jgi:hypothetical protein
MTNLLFGIIAIAAGVWGLWEWKIEFLTFVKGFLPASLILAGFLAVITSAARNPAPRKGQSDKD